MNNFWRWTLLAILFCQYAIPLFASDIRQKVISSHDAILKTNKIDPDSHIYGIPFGTTEEKFIEKYGNPNGYIRFTGEETGMLYGKSHIFVFSEGKLSGVRITHNIIDWQISENVLPNPIFDGIKWKLNNGIQENTNLKEVKQILGNELSQYKYEKFYYTKKAKVTLNFSHRTDIGDLDEAYQVYGLLIEIK